MLQYIMSPLRDTGSHHIKVAILDIDAELPPNMCDAEPERHSWNELKTAAAEELFALGDMFDPPEQGPDKAKRGLASTTQPHCGMTNLLHQFNDDVLSCNELGTETAEALFALADELNAHQRKVDKAKLGLASTAVVGGVLTILGFALVPFTFGASVGLSIAGGIIGGGSALGKIGYLIAEKVVRKQTLNVAQMKITEYFKKTDNIHVYMPELTKTLTKRERLFVQQEIDKSALLSAKEKQILRTALQNCGKDGPYVHLTNSCHDHAGSSSLSDVVNCIVTSSIVSNKAGNAGKLLKEMVKAVNAGTAAAKTGKTINPDPATEDVLEIVAAGASFSVSLASLIYQHIIVNKKDAGEFATGLREIAACLKPADR